MGRAAQERERIRLAPVLDELSSAESGQRRSSRATATAGDAVDLGVHDYGGRLVTASPIISTVNGHGSTRS